VECKDASACLLAYLDLSARAVASTRAAAGRAACPTDPLDALCRWTLLCRRLDYCLFGGYYFVVTKNEELMRMGRKQISETEAALERSRKQVEETIQIGAQVWHWPPMLDLFSFCR